MITQQKTTTKTNCNQNTNTTTATQLLTLCCSHLEKSQSMRVKTEPPFLVRCCFFVVCVDVFIVAVLVVAGFVVAVFVFVVLELFLLFFNIHCRVTCYRQILGCQIWFCFLQDRRSRYLRPS